MKPPASAAARRDNPSPAQAEDILSDEPRPSSGPSELSISDDEVGLFFAFFNEIQCIAHLSGRVLESGLPDGFLNSHFAVLDHLMRLGDGPTPLALARAFHVPKTTMTHTLSGLEKAGLIRFAPHPEDGRSKCVIITNEGRRFRNAAIENLIPEFAVMSQRFPAEAIAKSLGQLASIREHLDQRQDH